MNVYTFYEFLDGWGNQDEAIGLWLDSWRKNGWNPVILDQRVASRHAEWQRFNTWKRHQLPSVNPAGYDLACWHRWFAFDVMGGGVMVDYDVINRSLKPDEVILGAPIILEQCRVPCAVAADAKGAHDITTAIMDHAPKPRGDHYSDMYFFQDTNWPQIRTCREFGHDGWEEGKLIHFATGACRKAGLSKIQAIRKYT